MNDWEKWWNQISKKWKRDMDNIQKKINSYQKKVLKQSKILFT